MYLRDTECKKPITYMLIYIIFLTYKSDLYHGWMDGKGTFANDNKDLKSQLTPRVRSLHSQRLRIGTGIRHLQSSILRFTWEKR